MNAHSSTLQHRYIRLKSTVYGSYDTDAQRQRRTLLYGMAHNGIIIYKDPLTSSRYSVGYHPYGTNCHAQRLGFHAERYDAACAGIHLGNGTRVYKPKLMRFTIPDQLSPFSAGGIHPYAYCQSDPVNRTDPSGRFSSEVTVGMLLTISAILIGLSSIYTGGSSTIVMVNFFLGLITDVMGCLTPFIEDHNSLAYTLCTTGTLIAGIFTLGMCTLNEAFTLYRMRRGLATGLARLNEEGIEMRSIRTSSGSGRVPTEPSLGRSMPEGINAVSRENSVTEVARPFSALSEVSSRGSSTQISAPHSPASALSERIGIAREERMYQKTYSETEQLLRRSEHISASSVQPRSSALTSQEVSSLGRKGPESTPKRSVSTNQHLKDGADLLGQSSV